MTKIQVDALTMIDEVIAGMIKQKELGSLIINGGARLDLADNLDKWLIRDGELSTQEIGIATMIIKGFVIGYYHGSGLQ